MVDLYKIQQRHVEEDWTNPQIILTMLEECEIEAKKERDKLWSDKFDKYACIKNDKWYLEFKKSIENSLTNN